MRRYAPQLALAVALIAVASGCRKPKTWRRTKAQEDRVAAAILSEAPTPRFKVGAILDGKVELIGLDVSPAKPDPGGKVTLDFYWRCLEETGTKNAWMVFVHVEGPVQGGGVARVIADHHAVEWPNTPGIYPMVEWKKGQIIKDSKTVDLVDPRGKKLGPGMITVYAGVYDHVAYAKDQKDIRMVVKNPTEVKHDGKNRVELAKFAVGNAPPPVAKKAFKAPEMEVRKAFGAITVDGKLDEPSWRASVASPFFARPDGVRLPRTMATRVRTLWDDQNLYIGFEVADATPSSAFTKRDEDLWKSDVVEIYLDPDGDGKKYLEIQVSPKNVIFDALFESHRQPHHTKARAWNAANMKTAVVIGPTLGGGAGWTVEIALPWTDLTVTGAPAPKAGALWRANFFRIDEPGGIGRMASWSAVADTPQPDFHNLARAGVLKFAETSDAVKARAMMPTTGRVPMRIPRPLASPPGAAGPRGGRPTAAPPTPGSGPAPAAPAVKPATPAPAANPATPAPAASPAPAAKPATPAPAAAAPPAKPATPAPAAAPAAPAAKPATPAPAP